MSPVAGSIAVLLAYSVAEVVCVQHNITWTSSGVSSYRSTPLLVSIGDTLALLCPPNSYSTAAIVYTRQQYDNCSAAIGGGGYIEVSYCTGMAPEPIHIIHVAEISNVLSSAPDFRPGRTYYMTSFGNATYPNYGAIYGGECVLGLKMMIYISCGKNCSQCDSTTIPSKCEVCNPGYCLNTTSTCVPTQISDCLLCGSTDNKQVCSMCANGLVLNNGNCTANTEGGQASNTLSSTSIIAVAAGGGGGVLVILVLSGFCCLVCLCHKPRGKVSMSLTQNPESSMNRLIAKQEIAESEIHITCANEEICRQYFGTLGINENLCNAEDKCCCEKCCDSKQHKGWMLFGVRKADATWNIAYWGVPDPNQLKNIIAHGLGPSTSETKGTQPSASHIMVTPSLRYCLHKDTFAKKQRYSPNDHLMYSIRMVLKVRVRPSSYIMSPQSVGEKHRIDSQFENETLEWLVDMSAGNIEIESIMIKADVRNSEPKSSIVGK